MGEHRKINAYGEVTIVGKEKPKRRPKKQRSSKRAQKPDRREDVGKLLRQLSYLMAPWIENWDWQRIRSIERRIDRLLDLDD